MQGYRHKYDLVLDRPLPSTAVEAYCFLIGLTTERGGRGRYRHFKAWTRKTLPDIEWNPWFEDQIKEFCNDETAVVRGATRIKTTAFTGCGAAGKTFSAAFFAFNWWRVAPDTSAVILTSTTKEMLRKRIWSHIPYLWGETINPSTDKKEPVGHLIESRTKLLHQRGDDVHGIFGIAVGEGETQKAVQNIKGIHAPRVMVIVDEAEATPEAIFEAVSNLRKGCQEFHLVVLGNSVSRLDPHGQICEPAAGWNSVSVEHTSWPTKGVPRWQIEPGMCLHFDGTKSPNVKDRHTKHHYLYSWEDHCAAVNKPDYQQSMAYWSHDRGFWPPEGLSDRIFTEQMIEKYEGRGTYEFVGGVQLVGFLDPAFGGDECKLLFGQLGQLPGGRLGLQITTHLLVPIKVNSKDEADYQIARRVITECKTRGLRPENFGTDAVGTGRGVHAVIAGEWSPSIQRVETTVAPSERPSSTADGRPAREVFDRTATEFWWSAREVLQGGQLRGLYPEAIVQLCSRQYEMRSRKYRIETKEEFKARLQRSPDDADAVVGLIEVARRNGLQITTPIAARKDRDWEKLAKESGDIYNEDMSALQEFDLVEMV